MNHEYQDTTVRYFDLNVGTLQSVTELVVRADQEHVSDPSQDSTTMTRSSNILCLPRENFVVAVQQVWRLWTPYCRTLWNVTQDSFCSRRRLVCLHSTWQRTMCQLSNAVEYGAAVPAIGQCSFHQPTLGRTLCHSTPWICCMSRYCCPRIAGPRQEGT